MFLDSGDGVVFLGDYGPWYSPANNQYHLSREAAQKLLAGTTLKTCWSWKAKPLKILHSRSSSSAEEFDANQPVVTFQLVGFASTRIFAACAFSAKAPVLYCAILSQSQSKDARLPVGFRIIHVFGNVRSRKPLRKVPLQLESTSSMERPILSKSLGISSL